MLGLDPLDLAQETSQSGSLCCCLQIPPSLGYRILRRQELHVVELPEPAERGVFPQRGCKEDVRIENDPMHASNAGGFVVRDRVRIQAHGAHHGHCARVVGRIDRVG